MNSNHSIFHITIFCLKQKLVSGQGFRGKFPWNCKFHTSCIQSKICEHIFVMSSFLYNCKESLSKYRISIHTAVETNFPCCNILNLTSKVHHGTNEIWGYLENFETSGFLRSKIFWDSRFFWDPRVFWDPRALSKLSKLCQKFQHFQKSQKWKLPRVSELSKVSILENCKELTIFLVFWETLPSLHYPPQGWVGSPHFTSLLCPTPRAPHCCQGGRLRRQIHFVI